MNYPLWDVPAGGLFIAAIAIIHVFVSHFAVGGGLFLVLTERRARRDHDAALLDYVRRHSRFFILVTLVFGALTGVGIWFIIGLVHPSATASLIQLFVWFWAIEWTFFIVEIAAALVYYYGWDWLSPAVHVRVGWIYAVASWMSLVVINGILTFMLTPGDWIDTGGIWDAFFNPTYWPALVARTAAAIGLAGLYALLTASWMTEGTLKRQLAQRAGMRWVLPMAIVLPLSLGWYLWAAGQAGIDVAGVFGCAGAPEAAPKGAQHRRPACDRTGQRGRTPRGTRRRTRHGGERPLPRARARRRRPAPPDTLRADDGCTDDAVGTRHVRRRGVRPRRPAQAVRPGADDVRQWCEAGPGLRSVRDRAAQRERRARLGPLRAATHRAPRARRHHRPARGRGRGGRAPAVRVVPYAGRLPGAASARRRTHGRRARDTPSRNWPSPSMAMGTLRRGQRRTCA